MDWYSWEEIPGLLSERPPGLVFILGGPDTGKTTLFKRVAGTLLSSGMKVGLVDADLGQSTIGPPTTIGAMVAEGELPDFLRSQQLYFVGNNNPIGHIPDVSIGSRLMVDRARELGAGAVVFDSSGLINPPYGMVLKYQKLELLKPRYLIAIEKADELGHILSWVSGCRGIDIFRARPPEAARAMGASERGGYRQRQYRLYFQEANLKSFR